MCLFTNKFLICGKGKAKPEKVLKQCECNIFKCNAFMLSILFICIILRS